MNIFGIGSVDGSGKLTRNIALAAGLVTALGVGATAFLDRAAQDGTLAGFGFRDPARSMSNVPKSGQQIGGIRYGNVDYMPTASIPASQQKVKNAVSDPALGMPD